MSLQHEGRDFAEVGNDDTKVDYQRHEHSPLDLLSFHYISSEPPIPLGKLYPASARIYCPDIRVESRVALVFEPLDPNNKEFYDLSTLKNNIIAFRCINSKQRVARVGEIVGKQGVPLDFPKSDIDGIAFQTSDDMPWIDVVANLGFPGYEGTWVVYYHATSNNKMKKMEWQGYISRVTMSVQSSPGTILYGPREE